MLEAGAIFLAGFWAGMINVVVGSGTLVTFPVLLLFGYPPLTANISNNIGLVAGGLSGTWGYRKELGPNKDMIKRLLPASAIGGLVGALLLLVLPASAFGTIVPVLIVIGLLMVAFGPSLQRLLAKRRYTGPGGGPSRSSAGLVAAIFVLGMYGGYFGAAQGILIVGLMSIMTTVALQQINAVKNVLTTSVNGIAAITFMVVAWHYIDWKVTALIAVGSLLGGMVGARFGRKLPPMALRATIIVVGTAALLKMVFFS
ncbi:sulfite exporter TauE/SafE family protein [Arthrobacter sp. SDTb3-6]|uniref:sulfite exporter TauE/SafE family protein n=1 Tax=Arthrobacter sp. SDTb3-6 TaxID=2713571 RepID=UPI00159E301D|nr:sulfite exporter TauE/SafE family protein [Arthrobacter sp. SDTb3-6]NVM99564.1 sulfite exporter TauE/SafE family protein [Arthrobacter sp. SDTb3-6]